MRNAIAAFWIVVLALAVVQCTVGCATLEPDRITADVGHESHALQHLQATNKLVCEADCDHTTKYGRTILVGATAHWDNGKWHTEVSEAWDVIKDSNDGSPGPREIFNAKVSYDIWSRK
jgi:hypothetical protein